MNKSILNITLTLLLVIFILYDNSLFDLKEISIKKYFITHSDSNI